MHAPLFIMALVAFLGTVAAAGEGITPTSNTAEAIGGIIAVLVILVIVLLPLALFLPIYIKYRRLKKRNAFLESTKSEADANLLASQTALSNARAEAERIIQSGNDAKLEIIKKAQEEAQVIAGEALEAKGKSDEYEKTAKAFQNIIKGYGDEYIIPSNNLLDDLAEEYSFADAGKELKAARARSKDMAGDGDAAACDYSEEVRKKTAIIFIIDAFNGKVDSILSRARHDNFGTLAQEIRDARLAVNENGRAFRNARITEEYANARIEELRLGCVAFELRERDKAEQREIRERIREEEKARREQEKALREAAKQEETLRKAMEEARAKVESANAEERAKFEAKLVELQGKLAEAEAKAQRAKSMAEMTKSGHVYIISNIGSFGESVLKIGMTRRLDPMDRVWELSDASVPFDFDVHAMIFSEDAPKLEAALHRKFNETRVNKVNFRKEFFRVGITDLKREIEQLGIEVAFTIHAEAEEYRESLAIDKMAADEREKIMATLLMNDEKTDGVEDGSVVEDAKVATA